METEGDRVLVAGVNVTLSDDVLAPKGEHPLVGRIASISKDAHIDSLGLSTVLTAADQQ